jgi:deoxyribodipyrimidine photolyase-related protein
MDGDEPAGGQWNFDASNRKSANAALSFPGPARFEPDAITREVIDLVNHRYRDHFGVAEPFWFAVTPEGAEAAFANFLEATLARFGDYQDAMLSGERFLFHAVIAAYINAGLLDPIDVCKRVERAYRAGTVPINAAEGFIRQIIGWREYVRGIYWLKMPGYAEENALKAERPLPWFYWSGETDMACIATVVRQTRDEAYAHHIQRLMITGNFALLAGIKPAEVHNWYLAVYADAFEWVELPNTIGMSQFADGGLLASKPYASSGNYINKMSDYCKGCAYSVSEKTGENACPFNYLYWDFLARNEARLRRNPRLANAYRTWDRMEETRHTAYLDSARRFLDALRSAPDS